MAQSSNGGLYGGSYDTLLFELPRLKQIPEVSILASAYLSGDFKEVLHDQVAQSLIRRLARSFSLRNKDLSSTFHDDSSSDEATSLLVFVTGLAAFDAFLQINVTGPPTDFWPYLPTQIDATDFRQRCLSSLQVDGVSVYQYIPGVELFCLARLVFTVYFPRTIDGDLGDCKWMRIRVNAYHQRLLSGLPGGKMSDSTLLQGLIDGDLMQFDNEVLATATPFSTEAKVQFLLEKAQIHIMQGLDVKAREDVKLATGISGFSYALTGALGKKTKFQERDVSQLVVLAKSVGVTEAEKLDILGNHPDGDDDEDGKGLRTNAPTDLQLDDDTLLEAISFKNMDSKPYDEQSLPPGLSGMQPDNQPQLDPLDQIVLLTEATIKDTFSPLDKLNSEEILPYAIRVFADKLVNWQIYTQALLVRSRIEAHRARTQERSVLQLQAIVDQIIADTQQERSSLTDGIPHIRVTQFLPRAKASESAPVTERLRYIHPLSCPTRWEIETELAYAWSNVGSFVSALEIFKRLRLWAEVALCYHQVGQEDKARQVIRRQLYYSSKGTQMDQYEVDADEVVTEKWEGKMRGPPPPHAPRLWCILGDLDQDPTCWQRAWKISKKRYARAQRSLGEYYTKRGDLETAREAYMQATVVNRQNNDTWSRLGDIDLRVGNWDGAIVAFQQSIMIDDTDAKTYSNLGSALYSKFCELNAAQKATSNDTSSAEDDDELENISTTPSQTSPKDLIHQSLIAYKKGAFLAHDNWKIWDNVITIASQITPPSYPDMLLALRAIIRIRAPSVGEEAIDIDILRALVMEVTSLEPLQNNNPEEAKQGIYIPPRGSLARALIQVFDTEIIPLITKKAVLWMLVEKMAFYRKDYAGALSAAEKAWRVLYLGNVAGWIEDEKRWKEVVSATERLVGAYENYGEMEIDGTLVEKGWRSKARSAVRGLMGKGKDSWEGGEGWTSLEGLMRGLKSEDTGR